MKEMSSEIKGESETIKRKIFDPSSVHFNAITKEEKE